MKTGVYTITCSVTGEQYVGGTKRSFANRFRQHRYCLRKGTHKSAALQTAWNLHGEKAFHFAPIIRCEPAAVLVHEQQMLDALKPAYNTEKLAGSSLGTRRTSEQRERLKQRPQSVAKRYEVYGEMLSIPEMSAKYDIQIVTIRARLRQGWSGNDLVKPAKCVAAKRYEVQGKLLTRDEIAQLAGLPPMTVYSRIARGWTAEQLLAERKHRARLSSDRHLPPSGRA